MIFAQVSQIAIIKDGKLIADKHERAKLDRLSWEMSVGPKQLNEIAREVVGREIGDVRFLTEYESEKVRKYLNEHYYEISARCRRMRW